MKMEAKKASMCDKKYAECVELFRNLQDKYYDDEMPRVLDVLIIIP